MVVAAEGLHARPCAAVVKRVKASKCRVVLSVGDRVADGTKVFDLLMLEASHGTEVSIEVQGPDAARVLDDLARILLAPG